MQAAQDGARKVQALYKRRLAYNYVEFRGRKLCLKEVARENIRANVYPEFQHVLNALYWSCVEDVAHRAKFARRTSTTGTPTPRPAK